ncbi:MAG TPA: Ulp1 family isopeptidase, partial [Candidatus Babeliales bacterium]|nr:Ulp1 family isopeptidase [Candidatus Babeliales bacterium]
KDQKDMRCAPSKRFENGSCIPVHVLSRMAIAYNKHNTDKIPLDGAKEIANPVKYKRYLLKQFKKRLGDKDQRTWVREKFISKLESKYQKDLEKNTWRPSGPEGKFEWLATSHIDDVVKQYEEKYPEFKFLGAVPMDFDDLPQLGIRDLDFNKLMNEGKSKIGIVFNTDTSSGKGEHWISMYSDFKDGKVYFSDSYGRVPEPRVKCLMGRIAKFMREQGMNPVVDYNRTQHQKGGDACGVFSINFILRLLRGDSFEELTTKRMPDEVVNKCRNFYFT